MDRIDGLAAGDAVTAEQMRALFGCGLHPLAELRQQQQLEGPDLTLLDFQNVARLGAPFKIVDNDLRPFRLEVAKRIAALNTAIGWPADASIAAADRARVRTQVAREFFLAEHGREPIDARELTGQIAKDSPHRGAAGPQRAASSPVIVAKRQRRLSSIDEIVLSMYAGIQADDHLIEAAEPPRPLLH